MLPKFDQNGNLPKGIYKASLNEIKLIFGCGSARRKWLFENLEKIIRIAKLTGKLERLVVWGSFVSNKELPQDIDLLMIMRDDFSLEKVAPESHPLFYNFQSKIAFNADIFWAKTSIGAETINLWLETYQTTKDFQSRGIVEVIIND